VKVRALPARGLGWGLPVQVVALREGAVGLTGPGGKGVEGAGAGCTAGKRRQGGRLVEERAGASDAVRAGSALLSAGGRCFRSPVGVADSGSAARASEDGGLSWSRRMLASCYLSVTLA